MLMDVEVVLVTMMMVVPCRGGSWCGGDGGEGIKVAAMVLRLSHDGGDEVETRWWICGVGVIDMVVVAAG
nr:hypothetical protein [Tanacetum cinerariifolium]